MFALGLPVVITVVPDGAREAARIKGRVIGRTFEEQPRYDVRGDDGTLHRGLHAAAIERADQAASATIIKLAAARAA